MKDNKNLSCPIELLAPARNLECGTAAINFGADAVYIGAPRFSARAGAGNSLADIERLAAYAHKYWARVYVTLNTLLFDNELEEARVLIKNIHNAGADALIIQDMGILQMDLPPIPLFASTQTHNYSLERIKFLDSLGFQRIILARELSLPQIRDIASMVDAELEFFVHGALCVSYSGQCYMSHAVKNRSANRGLCAQCCRLPYTLTDSAGRVLADEKHLLSLKDLNLSAKLSELTDAGITSFKIEGRLKDINYVKNITAYYRRQIDELILAKPGFSASSSGKTTASFKPDSAKSFNRGFTEYFIEGKAGRMASLHTPKSIGKQVGKVIASANKCITVELTEPLVTGDGICYLTKEMKLAGMNVSKIDGNRIFCAEQQDLPAGTVLYRNHDHAFDSELKNSKAVRKINAAFEVYCTEDKIIIAAIDEDKNYVRENFLWDPVPADKPELVIEQMKIQFRKSGNSIFKINEVTINPQTIYFLPTAQINNMRRSVIESLEAARLRRRPLPEIPYPKMHLAYPEKSVSYHENITNRLAKEFYLEHGVEKFESGVELKNDYNGIALMTTKYCIKRELGICPLEHDIKNLNLAEPLLLKDFNNTYRLSFDCKLCQMTIYLAAGERPDAE